MKRIIDKYAVTSFIEQRVKQGAKRLRLLTGHIRLMPDFIVIGAQRSGTTSLYNYLIKHPYIAPALHKEVHFFDLNFKRGIVWYRAHFPSSLYKYSVKQIRKQGFVIGEASPYYIFHPHVPKRILGTIPQVKLIVLLRNPVDRAYSHYFHEVRRGRETLSFEDAIKREPERLNGEVEKIIEDENYHSFNYQHYSYLSRGIYVDQLKVWLSLFPKEQILILKSEDFYSDTPTILGQVLEFLNLPSWQPKEYGKYQSGSYQGMNATLRKHLNDYFKPHNRRLYEYLGTNLGWDS